MREAPEHEGKIDELVGIRWSGWTHLDVNDTLRLVARAMLDQKNRTTVAIFAMPPSTFGAICKGRK